MKKRYTFNRPIRRNLYEAVITDYFRYMLNMYRGTYYTRKAVERLDGGRYMTFQAMREEGLVGFANLIPNENGVFYLTDAGKIYVREMAAKYGMEFLAN